MKRVLTILFLVLFHSAGAATVYDVVVYGATPSGVLAGVAAAREGRSVMIVEPLPLVGGIMSGGLSFSDSNQMARETLRSLFEEFHKRIEKEYAAKGIALPYKVSEKDNKPWTYEPHIAEKVFNDLLKEAGVQVSLNETLKSAVTGKGRISAIRTYSGKVFRGKVFIDATYEGDLMAAAGVKYRVGRESRDEFGEPLAGAIYLKKPAKAPAPDNGPSSVQLISGNTRVPEGQGDRRIMTYSFRLCLSAEPGNQAPFYRPDNYDPARYELFRRFYKANPQMGVPFDMYPLPGQKIDGNNSIGGQISTGLVGENYDYPEAAPRKRQAIWDAHRSYTEGLLYFLCTDSAVPAHVRTQMSKLGYAKDEFSASKHFPPVLYVREGRRMVGEYFMTQKDIQQEIQKQDVIAIGSFPIDSHDCQRISTDSGFINEGTIFPVRLKTRKIGYPYQLPYRAITPKQSECANLLVPVCVSASHVAFSSVRVEPAWMVLGESAGIAAAIAVEDGVPVQQVDIAKLQQRLKEKGQVLELPVIPGEK